MSETELAISFGLAIGASLVGILHGYEIGRLKVKVRELEDVVAEARSLLNI